MKKIIFGLFVFYWGLPCFAQSNYTDSSELPDSPASQYLEPLLEIWNSGDAEQVKFFVEQNYAPELLDSAPMDRHIDILLNTNAQHGDHVFHAVRSFDESRPETELVLILKTTRTELWHAFTIVVSSEEPYKISSLDLSLASPPTNLPEASALTLEEAATELDNYLQRMTNKDVFSGNVLLAKNEKVLHQSAHGMASKRFEVPNNLQTKFNLGSMNKMFTSVAILQLIEAGKVSLNDKLSKFVDESWFSKDISDKIEIRHLLTHSSGLGSYFNKTYWETSKNSYRNLNDYKPLIANENLSFEPGTDNKYSNTGMFMLGVVIEKVTDKDYFSYIQDHIYTPASMIHSDSYEMDQPVPNLAIGYHPNPNNESGWNNNLYVNVLKGGPAGGGFSTVEDLHRFALALTGYKLLGKALTEEAYSPKPNSHSPYYGYGFGVRGTADNRIIGHNGGFQGMSTNMNIYLDKGYIAVVLSNYSAASRPIEIKIAELLNRVN